MAYLLTQFMSGFHASSPLLAVMIHCVNWVECWVEGCRSSYIKTQLYFELDFASSTQFPAHRNLVVEATVERQGSVDLQQNMLFHVASD